MNFTTAREHLKNVLLPTPLMYSPIFSEESGNNIYIKPENLQKTGAFKIRGAYNKMLKLTEAEKQRGVILRRVITLKELPMLPASWVSKR